MSIVERALEKAQRRLADAAASNSVDDRVSAKSVLSAAPVEPAETSHNAASAQVHGELAAPSVRKKLSFDLHALREAGALPPVDAERRLAAEFGRIKRPLVERAASESEASGGNSRTVLITSAVPGEGKTFTSLNLAISLARERDYHALLIDADVVKPQLSHLLSVRHEQGFLDSLRNPAVDVEELIFQTDFPGLLVLPVGGQSEQDSELLASRRMVELMAKLVAADERRLIILDSPPLLLTNEARQLTNAVGQVVVVVRAGVTPQQVVFEALGVLGAGRMASIVLNQVLPSQGHGRYYGHGQYGDYGRTVSDDSSSEQ